jgi:hypothetical protein
VDETAGARTLAPPQIAADGRAPERALRDKRHEDQGLPGLAMKRRLKQFALCLENAGNEASLILGKVYRVLPDARAAKDNLVRIVDESGDDYLFDRAQFVFVDFPQGVKKKTLALQKAG